jgi:hypothetical protein
MIDARISGEVRRVIHRRYHIHDYRFESCPDYTLIPIRVREQRRPVLLVQERNHVKSPHARWRW